MNGLLLFYRLTQTCERYGTESKWKITHKTSNVETTTTTSARCDELEPIDLTGDFTDNHTAIKRTSENAAGVEHSKKMRMSDEIDQHDETNGTQFIEI